MKPGRRMSSHFCRRAAAAIAALALAAPAGATAIYRSVQADGRVVYGDAPAAEARRVERLEPVPPGANVVASIQATPAADAARERFQARHAAIKTAYDEMLAARERLGMAGGGSRLAPNYFERLALLDREVAQARERLKQAQDRLNQVR